MASEKERYENIIASITMATVSQIDGVADMSLDTGRFFKSQSNSVQVTLTEGGEAIIDISFRAYYGYRVPDLAYDIQSKVKEKIESTTPYKVKAVNINVMGVIFK